MALQQQAPTVSSNDPFEELVKIMYDLPTAQALKDISRGRISDQVRTVIETMALRKDDLIRSAVIISKRERLAVMLLQQHYNLEQMESILSMDRSTVNISFDERKAD